MSLSAIVGLGNPGPKYAQHRHNVGFWFVDSLAMVPFSENRRFKSEVSQAAVAGHTVRLLKPATFMNRSGDAVQPFLAFYKLAAERVLIVHDDLDLPPGTVRLKRGGGHGGHNGLRDLARAVGADFPRLRVGIGHPGHKDRVLGYVLSRPPASEAAAIEDGLARARHALDIMLAESWDKAVQYLHTEPERTVPSPHRGEG